MSKKTATATSTVEDYLKVVLVHQQRHQGQRVGMGEIASALEVAPGTVTAMMKTLSESGLVDYEPYSGVLLTEPGHRLAAHVQRRHRLIELFLVEVMKLDWSEVHAEAELLEHAVSDRLIERMDEMLGHPSTDPHGDPIPDSTGCFEEPPDLETLLACAIERRVQIVRVRDQSAEFLKLLERDGLMPGTAVTVLDRNDAADTVELRVDGEGGRARRVRLGQRAAGKILVSAEV
jgi:DtxR family transcriptional regulator, Mn-dependent transcriptional regulator